MGPTGSLSGNKAAYSGVPPKIAPFSSRGPDFYMGLEMPSPTDEPVADVLKPNIVAPGVDIWAPWTPLATSDLVRFRGNRSQAMVWILLLFRSICSSFLLD